jgi:hypothetical protein
LYPLTAHLQTSGAGFSGPTPQAPSGDRRLVLIEVKVSRPVRRAGLPAGA